MTSSDLISSEPKISVLIIDDSLVFRRFLREVCNECPSVAVVGEGRNGIDALDLVLKLKPKVILMDMEMPLMDGMTALQHLMIHRPTPTIMFSSLSCEGTARAFDALKNGAIDFVCKDFIFHEKNLDTYKATIVKKIENASRIKIGTIDPIFFASQDYYRNVTTERHVIFCEDCGEKQILEIENGQFPGRIQCSKCGDLLDISSFKKHRRVSFFTVIGGGEGSFRNLLNSISRLEIDLSGSILVVIDAEPSVIDSFSEYLASVSNFRVQRATDGAKIEGGVCYIAAAQDTFSLKLLSTQYMLQKINKDELKYGGIDLAIVSVAQVCKHRSAAIIVSGHGDDGIKGIEYMMKNSGYTFVLNPDCCFNNVLPAAVREKLNTTIIENEDELGATITRLHASGQIDSL